jgi:hypothetical protein
MSVTEAASGVVDESVESMELAQAPMDSTWSPDAAYVATTRCGRRSTICCTRSRTFTDSKYSVDRADAEAYLWRLDSIASSLLAIAKRM